MFKLLAIFWFLVVSAYFANSWIYAHQQPMRDQQQSQMLVQLEDTKAPGVSKLVDEWRDAHNEPNDQNLTELRIMLERVKLHPELAAGFTHAKKQADLDSTGLVSVFGRVEASGAGLN